MDSTNWVCSVCLENSKHAKNQVVDNMLRCYCCNLNLPLEQYRKHHKKCKQCEQIAHREWQQANGSKWRKGGEYYKYVKKKDRVVDNIDEEQIQALNITP